MKREVYSCRYCRIYICQSIPQKLLFVFLVVVGGLRFYRDSSIFFFCFYLFCQLPSELAERNSTKIDYMLESECDLKMLVRNLGYSFPLKIGDQKTTFLDYFAIRNLTATLTAYVFAIKHNIDNRANMLATRRDLLHRLKTT